jgi:hypothetical protein
MWDTSCKSSPSTLQAIEMDTPVTTSHLVVQMDTSYMPIPLCWRLYLSTFVLVPVFLYCCASDCISLLLCWCLYLSTAALLVPVSLYCCAGAYISLQLCWCLSLSIVVLCWCLYLSTVVLVPVPLYCCAGACMSFLL